MGILKKNSSKMLRLKRVCAVLCLNLGICLGVVALLTPSVGALQIQWDTSGNSAPIEVDNSTKQPNKGDGFNTVKGWVSNISGWMFFLVGGISIIMVLAGGIMYAMALGNPGKIENAKKMILGAIIGVVIAAFAGAIALWTATEIKK